MAYHLGVLLLSTLNEDFCAVVCHLHRIEADDLTDGLVDRQVDEMAGNGKVLQFVVDEIDGIVGSGGVQVSEHFRE